MEETYLKVPNATRWNSTYDAWAVLEKKKKFLNALFTFEGQTQLKETELNYIGEFVKVNWSVIEISLKTKYSYFGLSINQ